MSYQTIVRCQYVRCNWYHDVQNVVNSKYLLDKKHRRFKMEILVLIVLQIFLFSACCTNGSEGKGRLFDSKYLFQKYNESENVFPILYG